MNVVVVLVVLEGSGNLIHHLRSHSLLHSFTSPEERERYKLGNLSILHISFRLLLQIPYHYTTALLPSTLPQLFVVDIVVAEH